MLLLDACAQSPQPDVLRTRDRALLELLLTLPLPVTQVVSLTRDRLDLRQGQLDVGNAFLRLSFQFQFWTKQYLNLRRDEFQFIFIRHDHAGRPLAGLTVRSVQRIVREHARRANLEQKVTPAALFQTALSDAR